MEFDGDVPRTVDLQYARRAVSIKCDFAVRVVVHEHGAVAPAELDRFLEVRQRRNRRRRVVRIVEVEDASPSGDVVGNRIERNQEVVFSAERDGVWLTTG